MAPSFSEAVDCSRCLSWCCQAYAFEAGAEFGHSKVAGERCRHLAVSGRCRVYTQRAQCGYSGCVGYTCYGAGPRLSEVVGSPRGRPEVLSTYFALRELCRWGWVVERLLAVSCRPAGAGIPAFGQTRLAALRSRLVEHVFAQTEWSLPDLRGESEAAASEVRRIVRAQPEVVNTAVATIAVGKAAVGGTMAAGSIVAARRGFALSAPATPEPPGES